MASPASYCWRLLMPTPASFMKIGDSQSGACSQPESWK